ncbi:MAG TPA: serine/threonine-protein kinase [Thermoanaerobaculia bacterium]
MSLHLRDIGTATAYATVGVGEVTLEMTSAVDAVNRLRAHPKHGRSLHEPESIFLLGQADVATMFETTNFKRVFDLGYPRVESHAAVVNWVFSVPYEGGRSAPPKARDLFRYILHLRLRRSAYGFSEIEEQIVNKLTALLGELRGDTRIHVGLGWSDLLLEGFFPADALTDFATFMIQLHGLKLRYGAEKKELPVLHRMLTVLGYSGAPPKSAPNRHFTLIRTKPGEYNNVEAILRDYGNVYMLDGKADFLILPRSKSKAPTNWLRTQKKLGEKENKDSIRKVETHLMMLPAEDFCEPSASDDLYIDVAEEFDRDQCDCETVTKPAIKDIDARMNDLRKRKLLPAEQRYAIDNTLFLLEASLRDSSICCDTRDAIRASHDGLMKVLTAIDNADRDRSKATKASRHKRIVSCWRRLDEWHRFTELLLRQRTVGSYEEILGQSDRSVVYSGGVQKFLYLADQLLADFARQLEDANTPRFATIYDSVKTILSFRNGVVRVPTSLIFSFPFVVPDLWHEVGGTLYFLRHGKQTAQVMAGEDVNEALSNLADHYADILVYLHGFHGNFERFLTSLTHGWTLTYGDLAEVVKRHTVGQLLLRAYLILELDELRALQQRGAEAEAEEFIDRKEKTIGRLIGQLRRRLKAQHASVSKYITAADWKLLQSNARTQDFSFNQRALYVPFLQIAIAKPPTDLSRFETGEIVPLGDDADLNALFGELAHQMVTAPKKSYFRTMAALGKSAAIEFHRRQIARRNVSEARPRTARDRGKTPVMSRRPHPAHPRMIAAGDRILGKYKIIGRLGSGGMGDVYHATELKTGRNVALKFARREAGFLAERTLITELKASRDVTHENICQVYDYGTYQGRLYIAMQFVGEDLSKRMKREVVIPLDDAIQFAHDIFAGLAKLHQNGIIHRDLKPSNVLIDARNQAKISDCGLAVLDEPSPLGVGTHEYMAPEQFTGAKASNETDLYSAGIVVYEMFTSERAISGGTHARMASSHAALQKKVPSAMVDSGARARSLKPLDALIMMTLVEDPDERPTAAKMRDHWETVRRKRQKKSRT